LRIDIIESIFVPGSLVNDFRLPPPIIFSMRIIGFSNQRASGASLRSPPYFPPVSSISLPESPPPIRIDLTISM